ncbi:hypothetical protein RclHR1_14690001 [Rhizophagus clarus]|uniref:Uncharacterized protein n=1 Tax=Rhizophagus clarus TaxID=94130 RepID=A0A2Z6R5T5_9GLOM|nr:hypothetical protein RclHR1_14690001 [Rhizophagus clarus]GES99311.1 hypothetical protein RCL_e2371_RclHR1_14690001 [Rhizophagus clarus]
MKNRVMNNECGASYKFKPQTTVLQFTNESNNLAKEDNTVKFKRKKEFNHQQGLQDKQEGPLENLTVLSRY